VNNNESNAKAICQFWTNLNGQLSHCFPQKLRCNSLQSNDCIEALKNNCKDCYLTVSQIQFWISICCNSNCWYAQQIKCYCNGNNPWQICWKVLYVTKVQFWLNKTGTMYPLKKTATLTNEKLLDLPEIVQSVVYQKYQTNNCCLSRWINCK